MSCDANSTVPISHRFGHQLRLFTAIVFFSAVILSPVLLPGQEQTTVNGDTLNIGRLVAGSEYTIKLVTIGSGDEVYFWWGHAGIVVENRRTGTSRFYDFGIFSFRQDHFYVNFAQGRLWFEVGVGPTQTYLEHYRNMNRTVIIQTLAIPADQREALVRKLAEHILPENRVYLYDHYFDNCATRPRDMIDEATGGAIRKATDVGAGVTFREITRRYTSHSFVMDLVLNYLMSDVIDREMTVWETMFLPDKLEEILPTIQIPAGTQGRTTSLVSYTDKFNIAAGRRTIPEVALRLETQAVIPGLITGLLCVLFAAATLKFPRTGHIGLGVIISVTGFISGILGTLLFFMSNFTDHVVTYGNENVVFTNPLSLALIVTGILLARQRRRSVLINTIVTGAFTLSVAILAVLKVAFPGLNQDNWAHMALFGSTYALQLLSCGFLLLREARRQTISASQSR